MLKHCACLGFITLLCMQADSIRCAYIFYSTPSAENKELIVLLMHYYDLVFSILANAIFNY